MNDVIMHQNNLNQQTVTVQKNLYTQNNRYLQRNSVFCALFGEDLFLCLDLLQEISIELHVQFFSNILVKLIFLIDSSNSE